MMDADSRRRLSVQQRRVIVDDKRVTWHGWDAKGRPVVSAMVGIPNELRRWAVLRNGDPTNVTEPVKGTS